MPSRYLNQFSLLSVHKCYENIFENMVFTQTISSGVMIFFLLFKLLLDCEVVLLREIRKSINLESANFKLDPELSPLNDHTLIPCRTIKNFFFILLRDLTSLKTSQNQSLRLKSLPLRIKSFVSLLITILYCSKINQYY